MNVTWTAITDDVSDEANLIWEFGPYTVNAVKYDTSEWVIRYSTDDSAPTELYSRGVFTEKDARTEARACMRELSEDYVEHADMTEEGSQSE